MFDLNIIKNFYESLSKKIRDLRRVVDRPLALSEKILYAHLYDFSKLKKFDQGFSYADFSHGNSLILDMHHTDGNVDKINCNQTYNDIQIEWFKNGSALNLIRAQKK